MRAVTRWGRDADEGRDAMRVVKGSLDEEELAALVAVLARRGRAARRRAAAKAAAAALRRAEERRPRWDPEDAGDPPVSGSRGGPSPGPPPTR
ncbi:hypothetical protein E1298_30520 [Actinomadura rubrisoli]|uniref:Acyl-CoA carboxylase subunit epsilon n=2 Tax=Actinomadura rubrisoli TaxID=2530368 RepID=A0A4R5AVV8_9ACTN|nr:hypothetical protein E1298_30520 [Actinomadura rubrisoli]